LTVVYAVALQAMLSGFAVPAVTAGLAGELCVPAANAAAAAPPVPAAPHALRLPRLSGDVRNGACPRAGRYAGRLEGRSERRISPDPSRSTRRAASSAALARAARRLIRANPSPSEAGGRSFSQNSIGA
jgi:hypothetical protein